MEARQVPHPSARQRRRKGGRSYPGPKPLIQQGHDCKSPANMLHSRMKKNQSRRTFLKVAPLAAAAIPLAQTMIFTSSASAADAPALSPGTIQLFTAEKIADAVKQFQAQLGVNYLYQPSALPVTIP